MTIGKIKITQAQADEIKKIQDIAYAIDVHSFNKRPDKAIAELSTADLARALLIGYEVEPKFQQDDWAKMVFSDGRQVVGQIDTFAFDDIIFSYLDENSEWQRCRTHRDDAEIPTIEETKVEKERRVWKSIDRAVKEFRIGDTVELTRQLGFKIYSQKQIEVAEKQYDLGDITGFYPAESFVSFEDGDEG